MKRQSVWVIEWHDGEKYLPYRGFSQPYWDRVTAVDRVKWLREVFEPKQRFRIVRYDRVVGG